MKLSFSIDDGWCSPSIGSEEEKQTSAWLKIAVGEHVATRVYDGAAQSVRSRICVPAYPLAYWIAASWWRLRHEPDTGSLRSPDWRMSHEMTSIGHGCIWPPLTFVPDGESVIINGRPSKSTSTEQIIYIEEFQEPITLSNFDSAIDSFLPLVLNRLDSVGLANTELKTLWSELQYERNDPIATSYRRIEAMLGFDPTEAPSGLVNTLLSLGTVAGDVAVSEVAAVCSGADPAATLSRIIDLSKAQGISAKAPSREDAEALSQKRSFSSAEPWQRGKLLAEYLRRIWDIGSKCLSDNEISDMLEIPAAALQSHFSQNDGTPIGLATRDPGNQEHLNLLFRKRNRPGRRFEAARFLCDSLLAAPTESWLTSTDTKTARQKTQRAFAAEFLCPIESLTNYLGNNISDSTIEDAADYYGVSMLAVKSHLINNKILTENYWDVSGQ